MKRVGWIAIAVYCLLLVLAGTAVVYGYTLPFAPTGAVRAAGLDTCNGKLCMFDLVPGQTSYSQAKQVLTDHITRDEGDHFHGQIGELALRVAIDDTGQQIREIDVQSSNSQPSLSVRFGKMIEQFGTPCYVADVRSGDGGIDLAYPSFRVWVLPVDGYLSLDSHIGGIILLNGSNMSAVNRACDKAAVGIPWRGFASMQYYQYLQQASGVSPESDSYAYPYNSSPNYYPRSGQYGPYYGP